MTVRGVERSERTEDADDRTEQTDERRVVTDRAEEHEILFHLEACNLCFAREPLFRGIGAIRDICEACGHDAGFVGG